jgi:hypothetical protein
VAINSDFAYRAAATQLWSKYYARRKVVEGNFEGCRVLCHDDLGCLGVCLQTYDEDEAANEKEYRLAIENIDAEAAQNFLNLPDRILCDPAFVDLANTLRSGLFADATVALVSTPQQLKDQLRSSRKVPLLALITRGARRQISFGGERVSLAALARIANMRVSDFVVLEGPSDGLAPLKTGTAALKKALQVGAVQVNWVADPVSLRVAVAPEDKLTAEVPSNLGKGGADHFVTVKGNDSVVLEALVTPDTPANRRSVRWTGVGAIFLRHKAFIGRTDRARVPLEVGIAGTTRKVVVWVIWSKLTAKFGGGSLFDTQELGASWTRTEAVGTIPGFCTAEGRIDWVAAPEPDNLTTDHDRPRIERPTGSSPPGAPALPVSERDGWQLAYQVRSTTFTRKGTHGTPKRTPPGGWTPSGAAGAKFLIETTPYQSPPPFGGSLRIWTRYLNDPVDVDTTPPVDGSYERGRRNARVFVRVRLGEKWYRCSDYALGRWHYFAMRAGGKWQHEGGTGHTDIVDDTNLGYGSPDA